MNLATVDRRAPPFVNCCRDLDLHNPRTQISTTVASLEPQASPGAPPFPHRLSRVSVLGPCQRWPIRVGSSQG